ncbi:hypothetical protein [Enterococcus sp. CSURQ0835]|uniref:hypothetical protein n=1 Tax=Enterococcus sp. CSURQ0835 TaxID=2681394 RepID=UPI00135CCD2B|nr:hypothetical protein [Enterococcus sp. CSURQ0835]
MDLKDVKTRKRLIYVIIGLLILIGAGAALFFHSQKTVSPRMVVSGDFLPPEKDAQKIKPADLQKFAQTKVDKSKFNMIIAPTGKIDQTTENAELPIQNPKENAYPVSVDLKDDATGDVVYTTGAIQPGYEVRTFHLEKNLTPGSHQMTAEFNIYDPATKERRGQVSAEVLLAVH